jgi:ADP-ribosylglycohydrolase
MQPRFGLMRRQEGEPMAPTPIRPDTGESSKGQGALVGLGIGDALAMPVHWYYDRQALVRDYGRVVDFLPPRNPHPDSILWRSEYRPANRKGDILHDQAAYWGQRNIHYHQFLRAGENTLNIKIAGLLINSLMENGRYNPDDFLRRYIAFMTTPGNHRDTYMEECHRHFFRNFARGVPPDQCGVEEKHIGGLPGIVPLVVFYRNRPRQAREAALAHLALTHRGKKMEMAATLVIDLLLAVLGGVTLQDGIRSAIGGQANPLVGHPFSRWLQKPDEAVIGRQLSTACYVEDAVPAVLYLALKYHDDPEAALIANTNLGGDNAGRGAVLGALMGAAHGVAGFPARWVDNLVLILTINGQRNLVLNCQQQRPGAEPSL